MTDYDLLYSKFQLKDDESRRLVSLHDLSQKDHTNIGNIVVTTFVTDSTGKEILKQEVQDAELV